MTTSEGPIQRWDGAGSLEIHTAGRSAQAGADMKVQGVEDFEDVKEQVMNEVREHGTVAEDEDEAPTDSPETVPLTDGEVWLDEVRRIRKLLESSE